MSLILDALKRGRTTKGQQQPEPRRAGRAEQVLATLGYVRMPRGRRRPRALAAGLAGVAVIALLAALMGMGRWCSAPQQTPRQAGTNR